MRKPVLHHGGLGNLWIAVLRRFVTYSSSHVPRGSSTSRLVCGLTTLCRTTQSSIELKSGLIVPCFLTIHSITWARAVLKNFPRVLLSSQAHSGLQHTTLCCHCHFFHHDGRTCKLATFVGYAPRKFTPLRHSCGELHNHHEDEPSSLRVGVWAVSGSFLLYCLPIRVLLSYMRSTSTTASLRSTHYGCSWSRSFPRALELLFGCAATG